MAPIAIETGTGASQFVGNLGAIYVENGTGANDYTSIGRVYVETGTGPNDYQLVWQKGGLYVIGRYGIGVPPGGAQNFYKVRITGTNSIELDQIGTTGSVSQLTSFENFGQCGFYHQGKAYVISGRTLYDVNLTNGTLSNSRNIPGTYRRFDSAVSDGTRIYVGVSGNHSGAVAYFTLDASGNPTNNTLLVGIPGNNFQVHTRNLWINNGVLYTMDTNQGRVYRVNTPQGLATLTFLFIVRTSFLMTNAVFFDDALYGKDQFHQTLRAIQTSTSITTTAPLTVTGEAVAGNPVFYSSAWIAAR